MELGIWGIREENNPVFAYYVAPGKEIAEATYRSDRYLPLDSKLVTEAVGKVQIEEETLRSLDRIMQEQQPGLVGFFDKRGMAYLDLNFVPLRKIIDP